MFSNIQLYWNFNELYCDFSWKLNSPGNKKTSKLPDSAVISRISYMYHILSIQQGTTVLASYWEEYVKNLKYLKDHTKLQKYQWKMYAEKNRRLTLHFMCSPIIVTLFLEMISLINKKLKNCINTQSTYHRVYF